MTDTSLDSSCSLTMFPSSHLPHKSQVSPSASLCLCCAVATIISGLPAPGFLLSSRHLHLRAVVSEIFLKQKSDHQLPGFQEEVQAPKLAHKALRDLHPPPLSLH